MDAVYNFTNTERTLTKTYVVIEESQLKSYLSSIVAEALDSIKNKPVDPYTRKETMEILHCKDTNLWNLQQRGVLHPIKVGGKCFFNRAEVDNLFAKKGGASC